MTSFNTEMRTTIKTLQNNQLNIQVFNLQFSYCSTVHISTPLQCVIKFYLVLKLNLETLPISSFRNYSATKGRVWNV
jgi:hypothetical protein